MIFETIMTIAVLGARCSLVVLSVCICVLYVVCVFHDRHLPPWQPRATTCWRRRRRRRIDEVHWIMTPKYRYTQDTYYACMCICMYVHVCVCVFWTLRGPMHMYYVSICLCGSPTSSSREGESSRRTARIQSNSLTLGPLISRVK